MWATPVTYFEWVSGDVEFLILCTRGNRAIMNNKYRLAISSSVMLLSFYFLTTADAFSYIDPGTGSYIIQIVIASVLTVGALSKIYWSRLKGLFASFFVKQSNDESKK